MMEESDYLDYEEPLFTFDNEQDEAAVMDQMHLHDDVDHEPSTPYGSAGASVPGPVHAAAAGSARLHISSATAWQDPAAHSSPPALSHSLSPRTPATFPYRQQDGRVPSRYTSRRDSNQYQHDRPDLQSPRQNFGQGAHPPIDTNIRRRELQRAASDDRSEGHSSHQPSPHHSPPSKSREVEDPDLITFNPSTTSQPDPDAAPDPNPNPGQGYVMIDAGEVEAMFNGNEESRITAQKFKDQVITATVQNGRVVYMVGQATVEWWMSPDMQRRRKAAGRKFMDVSGAVVSGAGSVLMSSTPLGRVYDSVSTNVTAFRAAPVSYTLQGLGIMGRNPATTVHPATTVNHGFDNGRATSAGGKHTICEPAIADDDDLMNGWEDEDEFDGSMGMGMGMGMFDEA